MDSPQPSFREGNQLGSLAARLGDQADGLVQANLQIQKYRSGLNH